jgi:broad-specificity NMP kinase
MDAGHIELTAYIKSMDILQEIDEERSTLVVNLPMIKQQIGEEIEKTRRPLIIEGHFSQDVISPKKVKKIFVLRRAPWLLNKELQNRGYNTSKIWENVESEILGICLSETVNIFEESQICEIDTSYKNPEKTTQLIIDILEGKDSSVLGLVDWMSNPKTLELIKGKSSCT